MHTVKKNEEKASLTTQRITANPGVLSFPACLFSCLFVRRTEMK